MRASHYAWLEHQREKAMEKFDSTKAVKHVRILKPGDIVVLKNDNHVIGAVRKLEYKYSEPLRIKNVDKGGHTYQLETLSGKILPNRHNYVNLRKVTLPNQCPVRTKYKEEETRRYHEAKKNKKTKNREGEKQRFNESEKNKKTNKNQKKSEKLKKIKRRAGPPEPTRKQPPRACKSVHTTEKTNPSSPETSDQINMLITNFLNEQQWQEKRLDAIQGQLDAISSSKHQDSQRIVSNFNPQNDASIMQMQPDYPIMNAKNHDRNQQNYLRPRANRPARTIT